jgi:DNA adenine methylase
MGDMNKFFNHELFAKRLRHCKHNWLMTCDDTEYIRNLFSFAKHIDHWEMKYKGMNKKQATNGKELFITNYDKELSN